jgi:Nucleotidyl transferase AbiEii toxin, Type IV TA system
MENAIRAKAQQVAKAIAALEQAASVGLDDYFHFSVAQASVEAGGGAKVQIGVAIGTARKAPINVDPVVRRTPTGQPTAVRLEPAVPIEWPDTWPEVLLYPLVDHIADKLCAMYEMHRRPGEKLVASTRFRDLGDLLLIAQQESIDGRAVQIALASEVERRTALGTVVLALPTAFEFPDRDSWARGCPKAAAEITGLRGCRTLVEARAAADPFITPLLSGTDPGIWNPDSDSWITR